MRYCTGSPKWTGVAGPGWNKSGVTAWTSTGRRVWLIMSKLAGLPPRNHPWLITHEPAGMLGLLVTNGAS